MLSKLKLILSNIIDSTKRKIKGNIRYKSEVWQSEKLAEFYHDRVENDFFNNVIWAHISKNLPKDANYILDAGAGTGRISIKLDEYLNNDQNKFSKSKIEAFDISENMLSKIPKSDNINKTKGSVFDIKFADKVFDATISIDVISHFFEWEKILTEFIRVSKKGGLIIFNYIPKEHMECIKDLPLKSKSKKAYSKQASTISFEELSEFVLKNNAKIVKLIPYGFLTNSELLRPFFSDKSLDYASQKFLSLFSEKYQKKSSVFYDLENYFSKSSDLRFSGNVLAILSI